MCSNIIAKLNNLKCKLGQHDSKLTLKKEGMYPSMILAGSRAVVFVPVESRCTNCGMTKNWFIEMDSYVLCEMRKDEYYDRFVSQNRLQEYLNEPPTSA